MYPQNVRVRDLAANVSGPDAVTPLESNGHSLASFRSAGPAICLKIVKTSLSDFKNRIYL